MAPDYLLLTPAPLSTTPTVRAAMGRDISTWAVEYNTVAQEIRHRLVSLATGDSDATSVLMPGSGAGK